MILFFSSMAISSSSTFYTLIYKLCDLCLLLLLLLLLPFQVPYACPSHLSNLSGNVEYISLRLYVLLLLPPASISRPKTASLARTTLYARSRLAISRDRKEFASRIKFATRFDVLRRDSDRLSFHYASYARTRVILFPHCRSASSAS